VTENLLVTKNLMKISQSAALKGRARWMNKGYTKPLSPEELAALPDEAVAR
jgi:hypothetical protein